MVLIKIKCSGKRELISHGTVRERDCFDIPKFNLLVIQNNLVRIRILFLLHRHQIHVTNGAFSGFIGDYLRVHGTGVVDIVAGMRIFLLFTGVKKNQQGKH